MALFEAPHTGPVWALSDKRAWRDRLAKFAASGLTIKAFCAQEGLAIHQFSWWRRELKHRDGRAARTKKKQADSSPRATPETNQNRFVAVDVTEPEPTGSLEIILTDPPRIAVTPGFDSQLLLDVLRVLEQREC